jgi:hypothetical protein
LAWAAWSSAAIAPSPARVAIGAVGEDHQHLAALGDLGLDRRHRRVLGLAFEGITAVAAAAHPGAPRAPADRWCRGAGRRCAVRNDLVAGSTRPAGRTGPRSFRNCSATSLSSVSGKWAAAPANTIADTRSLVRRGNSSAM